MGIEHVRVLKQAGNPKTGQSHEYSLDHVVARAAMRNPNAKIKAQQLVLFDALKQILSKQDDDALKWLLRTLAGRSRGLFRDVQHLRAFLAQDPQTISSSRLVTALAGLVTSMGYREQGRLGSDPRGHKRTPSEEGFFSEIQELVKGNQQLEMSALYDRPAEYVNKSDTDIDTIEDTDSTLSDVSDVENDEVKQPKTRVKGAKFKKFKPGKEKSWIAQAEEEEVAIRNHLSGSTGVACSVMEGLLKTYAPTLTSDEKIDLYGSIIMPNMARGGYHSFAETMAGLRHFKKCVHEGAHETSPLSPVQYEKDAYYLLARTADNSGTPSISESITTCYNDFRTDLNSGEMNTFAKLVHHKDKKLKCFGWIYMKLIR